MAQEQKPVENDDHPISSLYEWHKYVTEKERDVHTYGYTEVLKHPPPPPRFRGPPRSSPRREERRQNSAAHRDNKCGIHGREGRCCRILKEKKEVLLLANAVGRVATVPVNVTRSSSRQVTDAEESDSCIGKPQHYFATITDGNGEESRKVLGAMYCPSYVPCERPVRLVTRTAEVLNDLATQFNVCGDTTPTDDTGPFRTKSNVFIGVDTITCELKTFAETSTDSRYLLKVTVNRLITNATYCTLYWADSDDKNYYYMIPKRGGEVGVIKCDSNSKRTIESFRHWTAGASTPEITATTQYYHLDLLQLPAITVTDEHGDKELNGILQGLSGGQHLASRRFWTSTPTAEVCNDSETQFNTCGKDPRPGDDAGPFRTESSVFIGVNTDTCKLQTLDKPPTNNSYLLAVTVNHCIVGFDPKRTTAIYWARNNDENYYMIPKEGGELGVKRDSKQNMDSYRHWSNNTGVV